jgi:hypothetical protein
MKQLQVRLIKRGNAGSPAFDYKKSPYSKWHICAVTRVLTAPGGRDDVVKRGRSRVSAFESAPPR